MSLTTENANLSAEGKGNIVTDHRTILNRIDLVVTGGLVGKEKAINFDSGLTKFKMTEEEIVFEFTTEDTFPKDLLGVRVYNNTDGTIFKEFIFPAPATMSGVGEFTLQELETLL